jgi:hypothetical protein
MLAQIELAHRWLGAVVGIIGGRRCSTCPSSLPGRKRSPNLWAPERMPGGEVGRENGMEYKEK